MAGFSIDTNKEPNGAVFSSERTWRYALWRKLDGGTRTMALVGLNPSTADEWENDATIRRCIGFAESWGFGTLIVVNLFAYCATKPRDMRKALDPIGPENDKWLAAVSGRADVTLAAWGNNGLWKQRAATVMPLLSSPQCLGLTKSGAPKHPLYVRADTAPVGMEQT